MEIKVEAVTKEPRNYNGQVNWGVKLPGDGGWITLYREQKPNKGDTLDVNINERKGKDGKTYKDAFPVMPPLTQQAGLEKPKENVAAKITWDDYRELMKAAHGMALILEPDEWDDAHQDNVARVRTDRSTARAAIMNTALIAYSNGKFIVPKDDDDYVPPSDDDIPPF